MKPTQPLGFNRDSKGRFERDWIKRIARCWPLWLAALFALLVIVALQGGCQSSAEKVHRRVAARLTTVDGSAVAIGDEVSALGDAIPSAPANRILGHVEDIRAEVPRISADTADLAARAKKAEAALEDRARNRIEWALIIGGFLCWLAAGGLVYQLVAGGTVSVAEAVASPKSVIRRAGTAVGLFLAGCACFAAAVYFDRILLIGGITLAVLAVGALAVGFLHLRKHKGALDRIWRFEEKVETDPSLGPVGTIDYEKAKEKARQELDPLAFRKLYPQG